MGTHTPAYKVNVKFLGVKSQQEIAEAYNKFYVGVVSRVLKSSSLSVEKKHEILDTLIKKHSQTQISA